jgi:tetratricopeptide (TPR) repeat protein
MEIDLERFAQLKIVLALAPWRWRLPARQGQTAAAAEDPKRQAFALEQQGNNAEAETAWRAILRSLIPRDAEPYAHLGLLEARQQHYKDAVPLYRKALALNPAMPGLRLNLGLSLFKSGALKEAIQTFHSLAQK